MKRKMTVRFEGKTSRIVSERFVSMHNRHFAAQQYKIIAVDYDDEITIKAGLDVDLINDGVERYRSLNQKHILPMEEKVNGNSGYVVAITTQSNIKIACSYILNANKEGHWEPHISKGKASSMFTTHIKSDEELTMTKRVILCNSLTNDDPLNLVLSEGRNLKSYEDFLISESVRVDEEMNIDSDKSFKAYAEDILKKAHGDKYDEAKANKVINGLLDKYKGEYGAMIGALKNSLGS